ncbi:hypothetical protein [uncultured Jatrophihabitans sp.]|uniref:DUF7800 domain-containing protein n=1 Tax=uncultured Jatrophihabitans sp. TaxID=1610747 RepID=UPI0035C982EE
MTRLLIGPVLRYVGTTDATVWVETDEACVVEVLGHRERTWSVAGHHYALVLVTGLAPGSSTEYEVHLDGERAWPSLRPERGGSRIRTLGDPDQVHLAFGSCRYGRAAAKLTDKHFDADSLAAFARDLAGRPDDRWPDAMLMLGDQVYADETSVATRRRIAARRDIETGAKDQVADFEEYTWLYLESWTDPDVRTRWSYRRDFGRTRLLMVDSRCGRILAGGTRSMVSKDEFAWIVAQTDGDYDHLLIGTSLPWLLARSLHDIEAWDERLAAGVAGARLARFGEWLRRAGDLEHWAAFRESFEALGRLIASVGCRANAPATICVLSGDVHHAYVARARFATPVTSAVYQLTCSPLHNYVPIAMRVFFRVFWSRAAAALVRALMCVVARAPRTEIDWQRLSGPFFGNEIAVFATDGRRAEMVLHKSASAAPDARLVEVDRQQLAG